MSIFEKPWIDLMYAKALSIFMFLPEIVPFMPSSPTNMVPYIDRPFNLSLI